MARKEVVTRDKILEIAFELTREEGIENVTARKLAGELGCSTQPIFRVYANMNQLYEQIYLKAIDSMSNYINDFKSDIETPFVQLGLAYICYAKKEGNLFKLLFNTNFRNGRKISELLDSDTGRIDMELARAKEAGCTNPQKAFRNMWIFIYGCATMEITGDYEMTQDEIEDMLDGIYKSCLQ